MSTPQSRRKPAMNNSMNPWNGQRAEYQACVQDLIEEKLIAVTFDSPMVGYASKEECAADVQKQLWSDLLDWIRKCRQLFANRANLSAPVEQLEDEVAFLIQYFATLTLADLQWLRELYILRRLPMDYPDIVVFNADFLSRIITCYQRYKREKGARLSKEVLRRRQLRATGTPELRAEAMRYMLAEVHRQLKEERAIVFMLSDVYGYLLRIGRIAAAVPNNKAAKAYAQERTKRLSKLALKSRDTVSMKDLLEGRPDLSAQHQARLADTIAMEWIVKDFFSRNPLEQVLKKVTPEQFKKNDKQ